LVLKTQKFKIFDQSKKIFTEMEEIELGITNKEKLNIYITFFQNNYKNIVRFDLNSNPDEYLETLKIIILSRLIII